MTDSTDQLATVATTERLERLLRPGVTGHPTSGGYLDALPGEHTPAPGRAQAAWQTGIGSTIYQRVLQPAMATVLAPSYRTVAAQLRLEPGQTVADVGCGPGNVTTALADAVGPHGLAVGLDLSAPMLERAAAQAPPTMGLIRADATRLPLETGSVDAACATAVVMLVPEPAEALAELLRVVKPGGPVLVMVPAAPTGPLGGVLRPLTHRVCRFGGARTFTPDGLAILLERLGCERVHTEQHGNMLTARTIAPRPSAATAPPDTAAFDAIYRGDYAAFARSADTGTGADAGPALDRVPWDIGEAQPVLRELEADGRCRSEVLDIGCGPGENALYLAERGYRVCALDGAPAALEVARERAKARGLDGSIEFGVADATELEGYTERFRTVIDSALYHCLTEQQRHAYLGALRRACVPGARLHLLCFSDRVPDEFPGPYRISERDLRETLQATGWRIERLEPSSYTTAFTRAAFNGASGNGSTGGVALAGLDTDSRERVLAPAWLVTAERG